MVSAQVLASGWPLWANILVFAVATLVVWIAGTRLVLYGDEMSERFNLGQVFVGLIILAAITSLPEVVTTLTAAVAGNGELVMGNIFGSVTIQTAVLAVADLFVVRHALTSWPRKPTHALEAVLLILFLAAMHWIVIVGDRELVWGIGTGAVLLCMAYPGAIMLLRRYDERASWAPVDLPETEDKAAVVTKRGNLSELPSIALFLRVALASVLILLAGFLTADRADSIAQQTGLGGTFVGVSLLAVATSTPEISTTFAAARIGAYTLAISNIFGSNLIMVALVLPADIAYRAGPILGDLSPAGQIGLLSGLLVTTIYVAGLLLRRTPRVFGAGVDSVLVLAVYLAGLVAVYEASMSAGTP